MTAATSDIPAAPFGVTADRGASPRPRGIRGAAGMLHPTCPRSCDDPVSTATTRLALDGAARWTRAAGEPSGDTPDGAPAQHGRTRPRRRANGWIPGAGALIRRIGEALAWPGPTRWT